MGNVVLKATRRSVTGKTVKALRRQGYLPAVMYGHHFEPVAILLDAHETSLALAGLSSSTIVNIDLEGEELAALIREKQKDYLRNRLVHVDFQVVSQNETIRADVVIEVTGVAPAVKDFNAVIVNNLTSITVEALPRDLPESLTVDISGLENIGDTIKVRDLNIASNVSVHTDLDEIVVIATGAAIELEEEEVEEVEEAEPEVIERGKKEDEDEE
jgi:large subunit ribosomal protein L25